jgi:general secretion pathway protein G
MASYYYQIRKNTMTTRKPRQGFSLVELVIVIVIMGVIAAIAVPRISRGAAGAGGSALRADLYILRNAIDLYAAEHNGDYPTVAGFVAQMTQYSDADSNTSASKVAPFLFGPYLVSVPTLKVGTGTANGKGKTVVGAIVDAANGWVYNETLGTIVANSVDAADDSTIKYNTY